MSKFEDPGRATRQQIMRRANQYTLLFFGLAGLLAIGGSGLIAVFLRPPGWSLATTWAILFLLILLPSAIGYVVRRYRESAKHPSNGEER